MFEEHLKISWILEGEKGKYVIEKERILRVK